MHNGPGPRLLLNFLQYTAAPAKQQMNYKMAHSVGNEKPKTKRKFCGQCENKAALL
ncbi:hypothetical protein U0070_006081, partial [Myodes glareolus]